MAIVRELQATFTAGANGFVAGIRGIKKEVSSLQVFTEKLGKSFRYNGQRLQDWGKEVRNTGNRISKGITLPVAGATAAVGGLVGALGWGRLKGIDNARAQLEGMGYTAKEVEEISAEVSSAIDGGMMTMAEGTSVAAGALAAGVKQGKELEKYLKLVDAAAVGANRPVADMAMIFNRVQGSGKLMTEELNMIEDGMPGFSKTMADHLDVSMENFRKMVTDGKVSSSDFLTVMDGFAGGMADSYSKTWSGMVANTKANIGKIGESLLGGVFEQSKESISEFLALLRSDNLRSWASETGEKLGEIFTNVVGSVKSAVEWFMTLDNGQKKLIGTIGGLVVATGPLLTFLGFFLSMIGNIMTVMSPLLIKIKDAGGLLKFLAGRFSFLLGPVGIAIGLITLLTTGFIALYKNSETFRNGVSNLIGKIKELGSKALSVLKVAIDAVVSFFKEQLATIQGFWKENSAVIIAALKNVSKVIKNVFENGILPVIKFVMPFILALIKSVWGNIQGVIQGALKVIMGAIKVFSGLLTGNWSKMWEGVQQILKGAVQLAWNWINLMFIGRILKGVGGFATSLVKSLKGGWDKAINGIKGFVGTAKSWFDDLLSSGKQKFDDLVSSVKEMPGKMKKGLTDGASAVKEGMLSIARKLVEPLEGGVNGVIDGVNWVLDLFKADTLDPWVASKSLSWYAKGTSGHKGGHAVLGDGTGDNSGSELTLLPNGKAFMSADKPTLYPNLPKGTQVISAKNTRKLLESIPAYKDGTGLFNKVLGYIKEPKKIFDLALDTLGISPPGDDTLVGKIASGGFTYAKDKAIGFIKGKIEGLFGSDDGGNIPNVAGSGVQRWAGVARRALMMTGQYTVENLQRLLYQMQTESGGNPRAINLWDINAKRGTPSKGLMQVIDPTFQTHKMPGFNNIWNPLDNILASIRYAVNRYGTLAGAYRGVGYENGIGFINEFLDSIKNGVGAIAPLMASPMIESTEETKENANLAVKLMDSLKGVKVVVPV